MNTEESKAIVLSLVHYLRSKGSWAGQTHVQKTVYILQEQLGTSFGFDFVLYIYGPFSFGLKDTICELLADEMLTLEAQPEPYRPKLQVTQRGQKYVRDYRPALGDLDARIDTAVTGLAPKGVVELERLSTAIYVLKTHPGSKKEMARQLIRIKPRISPAEAQAALGEAKALLNGQMA